MTKAELQEEIEEIIIGCQNDIQEYFMGDVPLESHPSDIDSKMDDMRMDIRDLLDTYLNT